MNYQIVGLSPRSDLSMGAWGFSIRLFPGFKEAVEKSGIDEDKAWKAVENMGRSWLDGCGFSKMFEYDDEKPRHMYKPNRELRISWGEWGPEHITVPGNACGLDMCGGIMKPKDGEILTPHNIDSMAQTMLLLVVFTWFAETIHLLADDK
ncbi:hypothetical protein LCGC14_1366470 [marine sediment metagenome]|uniref:Uncharacterized protein n=1 Tax=marine sediment metagenome TaxID=412755 RepID=A0A0F9K762_9ZZZZ